MNNRTLLLLLLGLLFTVACSNKLVTNTAEINDTTPPLSNYLVNKKPLVAESYLELPLGAIQPEGWLKEQLQRMADGMTGNLDSIYPSVLGPRNGWLGGDGDGWERGPYWIDGLLPLAFILQDEQLKGKTERWVNWTLDNQMENGYLGPIPFKEKPAYEPGLQRGNREDWWPKMVMLKILQQYYNATQDARVITALTKYFRYQLQELPKRPLDYLTFWANRRGGDNLQVIYWLYNITEDPFLLDLGDLIKEQTFPWTSIFLNDANVPNPSVAGDFFRMKRYPFDTTEINSTSLSQIGSIHTVNLAQGLKQPMVLYQREGDEKYIIATKKALKDLKTYHGQAQGMYGGDEPLHGANPLQGIEFCSISEEMFSLETIIKISGDMEIADLLERIAYNALPAQAAADYSARQYFQAANQITLKENVGPSFESNNHKGTDFVFGQLTGYPCCTTNMHQSWPKFVQNLFYATASRGVAAIQYAPSTVRLLVADSVPLVIKETTGYPFRETINFELSLPQKTVFPFHLRIPAWAKGASITVNGKEMTPPIVDQVAMLNLEWSDKDIITLQLPMKVTTSKWYEFTTAVERGPLVYALGVRSETKEKNGGEQYGTFTEHYPAEPWNFGLVLQQLDSLPTAVEIIENDWDGSYPWTLANAPISLKIKALEVPEWTTDNYLPQLPNFWGSYQVTDKERFKYIDLVPYGCTTLRIAQFPTYNVR